MASTLLRPCCTPSPLHPLAAHQEPRRNAGARLSQANSVSTSSVHLRCSRSFAPLFREFAARVFRLEAGERGHGRFGAVCMVLPSGVVGGKSLQSHPWEARAVKSFSMAELEARKLKYPNTGTESLLLGILTEGTSAAARFLRRNGVTLFGAKEEIIKLLGKADMYYFSPEHPPLTSSAEKALTWAVDPKNRPEDASGEELSATMMVLGVWAQKGSAGQKVLQTLGINDDKIAELASTMKHTPSKRGSYQQLVQ